MKYSIGSFLLWMLGWKVKLEGELNVLDRCVLVVAPHTSNWDYYIGVLAYWKLRKRLKIIIKDNHTKAFYGGFVRRVGAIGVDRSKKEGLTKKITELMEKEKFSLVITPEGSRSYAKKWHLGFYHIAKAAKTPIVFAAGDYKNKIVRIGKTIPFEKINSVPMNAILDELETYFKAIPSKFPAQYNPKIY